MAKPGSILRGFTRAPWPLLFATAGVGLVLCIYNNGHAAYAAFCISAEGLDVAALWFSAIRAELVMTPLHEVLSSWALMLVAMMPPLLAMPLMHVWRSSLPRRRVRALVGFLLGYSTLWMAAGLLLSAIALLLSLVFPDSALGLSVLLAVLWSASPWHRAALNRGHRLQRIGLFGWKADRDCLGFGLSHGVWCIGACWAWMLVPLLVHHGHIPVMLLAGAIMLAERLAAGDRPSWRVPLIAKALGICRLSTYAVEALSSKRH
ncbi:MULTISPECIES: DUF2182 domain-containing protein [Pseudomonas]|jgi:predicted metal-binding membrane protein|uniref:DUF2182 domain-containing protein n=1 Tax=Pseudomonas putida NBRC 14164 TaxID=1211579 RepID=A0ABM7ED85_PSEPU|nr:MULTISPECIES: DUF2182 domain-containing protein [Pseudomonas]EKT4462845.1 DUF2182 domain-containing protein [Pseudomonas putida]EKT4555619.1 DUF2182 domain-containing protein [Pseudomonas putida]ELF6209028.1 DUF2182 domain-containing protein [Pseudomonas putida]MCX9135429.1 DUF2182 domain-containing protein [Pseudomonas sp. DCB_PUT]MDD1970372.1 DUF2182 domain-containing protein [Pseudomonas putida]